MHTPLRLVVLLGLSALSLAAQTFPFSDSLTGTRPDPETWIVSTPATSGSGTLNFGGLGLTYSVGGSPTADDRQARYSSSAGAPTTVDWSAQVTAHLSPYTETMGSGAFANLSLVVIDTSNSATNYTSIAMDRYNSGSGVVPAFDVYFSTSTTPVASQASALPIAILRIDYTAATQSLIYSFASTAAPTSFIQVGSAVSLASWSLTSSDSFGFALSGASSNFNLPENSAYVYDFSVGTASAVPEPATTAILAGLSALGLVLWRRRRSRAGAVS